MSIDDFWLDDAQMMEISCRRPSTRWGEQLISDTWPARYAGLVSSDTYRGCAIVLLALHSGTVSGISLLEIEQLIDDVDHAVKRSNRLVAGSDACGGALLTTTNAWDTAHAGLTSDQIRAALESELIYAAGKFVIARQLEMSGHTIV